MSFNPNITIYGRWIFAVDSESRPGLIHLVDLEPELDIEGNPEHGGEPWKCSCEAHHYNVTRPCKHVKAVLVFLGPIFQFLNTTKTASSIQSKVQKRQYQLDPNKRYDATKTNSTTPER